MNREEEEDGGGRGTEREEEDGDSSDFGPDFYEMKEFDDRR